TSDAWIFLDLDRRVQAGQGDDSTVEIGVRAAASIADRALLENRAVGLTTSGHRIATVPADRGGRHHLENMQLLAAVDGAVPPHGLSVNWVEAKRPLAEVVVG